MEEGERWRGGGGMEGVEEVWGRYDRKTMEIQISNVLMVHSVIVAEEREWSAVSCSVGPVVEVREMLGLMPESV
jgi:hypothetical protein